MFVPIAVGKSLTDVGDAVNYSVRFNSADSPSLTKTFGGAGNRKTWTLSYWIKRSKLGTAQSLFYPYSADSDTGLLNHQFDSSDRLCVQGFTASFLKVSTQVFRDVSKFYHIVVAVDTTQATADNRIRVYVNNVEITTWTTNAIPAQNADTAAMDACAHSFGKNTRNNDSFVDGYFADITLVNGQQLTPSSFGRTSADTGAWVHKNYAGTYSTNGTRLQFNTGASASDLGTDTSGNGNTFTVTNLSVTAGAGNDWLADTPTNTYATLNPLQFSSGAPADGALSSNGATYVTGSTIIPASGKWKAEATVTSGTSTNIGVLQANPTLSGTTYLGLTDTTNKNCSYRSLGNGKIVNGVATGGVGASYTTNDTITVELDMDANPPTASFYKNTGALEFTQTLTAGFQYQFASSTDGGAGTVVWNFGQRAFTRTPSTGFLALCTANLPTPAIGATAATRATKHFDVRLRAGTSANASVSDLGFSPDLLLQKDRSPGYNWFLSNVLSGLAAKNLELSTSSLNGLGVTTSCAVTADASGYSYSDGSSSWHPNLTGTNYANYLWKMGGAGATAAVTGLTSATRSVNALAGQALIRYRGSGSAGTVAHGLSQTPEFYFVKSEDASTYWYAWFRGMAANTYLRLNAQDGTFTDTTVWNNTLPDSSVINIGTNSEVNTSGHDYVMFVAHSVPGYSAIKSWIGNSSTDGTFVFTDFAPLFAYARTASNQGTVFDTRRDTYNLAGTSLGLHVAGSEGAPSTASGAMDFLSNGVKWRNNAGSAGWTNASATTYYGYFVGGIPFKFSNAR